MTTEHTSNRQTVEKLRPGARLRKAREEAHLSFEAVAHELRMNKVKLHALEADEYDQLVADTFVRGYLRSYAKLVHLDGDELVASYDNALQKKRKRKATLTDEQPDAGREFDFALSKPIVLPRQAKPIAIAVGAILLWLLAVSIFHADDAQQVQQFTDRTAEKDLTGSTNRATTDGHQLLAEELTSGGIDLNSAAIDATGQSEGAVNGSDVLTIVFSGESWVEVSDARGDVLFTEQQQAGDELSLTGLAPFKVMLGNMQAARIRLNGTPITVNAEDFRESLRIMVGEQSR